MICSALTPGATRSGYSWIPTIAASLVWAILVAPFTRPSLDPLVQRCGQVSTRPQCRQRYLNPGRAFPLSRKPHTVIPAQAGIQVGGGVCPSIVSQLWKGPETPEPGLSAAKGPSRAQPKRVEGHLPLFSFVSFVSFVPFVPFVPFVDNLPQSCPSHNPKNPTSDNSPSCPSRTTSHNPVHPIIPKITVPTITP